MDLNSFSLFFSPRLPLLLCCCFVGVRFPFLFISGRVSHVLRRLERVYSWMGVAITQVCGFEVITQCVIKILIALGFFCAKAVRVININPKMSNEKKNTMPEQCKAPTTPPATSATTATLASATCHEQWGNKNCSAPPNPFFSLQLDVVIARNFHAYQ